MAEHKPNQYPNYQLMVYDQANTACVSTYSRTQSQIKNGVEISGLHAGRLSAPGQKNHPARHDVGQHGVAAACPRSSSSFPIPRAGRLPKWTPEPAAQHAIRRRSERDAHQVGRRCANRLTTAANGVAEERPDEQMRAQLAFDFQQKGQSVTNWRPVRVETSDAAGNHVQNKVGSTRTIKTVSQRDIMYQYGTLAAMSRRGSCAWNFRGRPVSTTMKFGR
jgi:hypothetical protein